MSLGIATKQEPRCFEWKPQSVLLSFEDHSCDNAECPACCSLCTKACVYLQTPVGVSYGGFSPEHGALGLYLLHGELDHSALIAQSSSDRWRSSATRYAGEDFLCGKQALFLALEMLCFLNLPLWDGDSCGLAEGNCTPAQFLHGWPGMLTQGDQIKWYGAGWLKSAVPVSTGSARCILCAWSIP